MPMKYSPSQQKTIIERNSQQALYRVMALLNRDAQKIVDLAVERGYGLGVKEYGDASFHKSLSELKQESLEELADCVFYNAIYSARESGQIK